MIDIFDDTCAYVSRRGGCNQCIETNGRFNPKQDCRAEEIKIKMVRERAKHDSAELYNFRLEFVRTIDPLHANGSDLHDAFLKINHQVNAVSG